LLSVAIAMALAAFVLPSGLRLPQTNPSQTLEYAPVPPSDKDNPPPVGNMNSLGLGSSDSIAGDTVGGNLGGLLDALPQVPDGQGAIPRNKRCVGNPPRQTEDLLAPPCVAYFTGNNFGATYQGVTKEEVRILFYFDGGESDAITSQGTEKRPSNTYIDLYKPPGPAEHVFVRALRVWQRYFNERYQTYNRGVHFFVYYSPTYGTANPVSPEKRRADAAENFQKVKPFAVLGYPSSLQDDYLQAMAKHGVLNFGSLANKPATFFQRFPGLIWSFLPSLEEQAKTFGDFVCTEVIPHKVSFSGNPGDAGKPRKLGIVSSVDPRFPDYTSYAKIVKKRLQQCGGDVVADESFPVAKSCSGTGYYQGDDSPTTAANMAKFRQAGVTTIIWPTGMEGTASANAARSGYLPEWVVAGDSFLDNFWTGQCQDQTSWHRHAIAVTPTPLIPALQDTDCNKSLMQTDPNFADAGYTCSFRSFYEDLRQLFTGIQVAGPRLTAKTIDEGFHAIPPIASKDPHVPACFYNPGDYTCVKDMAVAWWDKDGQDVNGSAPGCWRMVDGGARHFAGEWPRRDAGAGWRPNDPCSGNAGAGLWP
jgi:hypothetical protein